MMKELMNDLGIETIDELLVYMQNNPDQEIVVELKEILSFIQEYEGDDLDETPL